MDANLQRIRKIGINHKNCIWAVDDIGNLLFNKNIDRPDSEKTWRKITNVDSYLAWSGLEVGRKDLWLLDYKGDIYLSKNVCL